ncbi:MAG: HAD family hydrolase [Chloroflexota bacterium]|nr:HAD family hydrolase [Chloroflexota bacterium]
MQQSNRMADSLPDSPDAILFDLDGTLADSMTVIAEALVDTLARFGHTTTVEGLMPHFGPRMQEVISAATGVDLDEADRIYADYLPRYYGEYMARSRPLPGGDALLDALAPTGVPMGIVTSKIERGAHDLLAHLGWSAHFGVVVGRDTTPEMKPSPVPVRYALDALGADPSRTVSVGDTEADMQAASAAGVAAVIGLTVIRTPEQMLRAGATHTCEDLDAVRGLLLTALKEQPA